MMGLLDDLQRLGGTFCKVVPGKVNPNTGKRRKVPRQLNGEPASVDKPRTFTSDLQSLRGTVVSGEGIGVLVTPEMKLAFIDFDFKDGNPNREQQKIIDRLGGLSSLELSQSRKGYHFIGKINFQEFNECIGDRVRVDWGPFENLEVYYGQTKRFMWVTEDIVGDVNRVEDVSLEKLNKVMGGVPRPHGGADGSRIEGFARLCEANNPDGTWEKLWKRLCKNNESREIVKARNALKNGFQEEGWDDLSRADKWLTSALLDAGAYVMDVVDLIEEYNPRGDQKYKEKRGGLRWYEYTCGQWELGRTGGFEDTAVNVERPSVEESQETTEKWAEIEERIEKIKGRSAGKPGELEAAINRYNRLRARDNDKKTTSAMKEVWKLQKELHLLLVLRLNRVLGVYIAGADTVFCYRDNFGTNRVKQKSMSIWLAPHDEFPAVKVGADRNNEFKPFSLSTKNALDAWTNHKERREFPGIPRMRPHPKLLVGDSTFDNVKSGKPFNLFEGCLYDVTRGVSEEDAAVGCVRIRKHIEEMWAAGDGEMARYMFNWLARMVQKPWKQAETAIVLKSGEGVGKNIIIDQFQKYYGQHFETVADMDRLVGFNERAAQSVLLFLNEATFGGSKKTAGTLKMFITDPYIKSEQKNMPSILVNNCTHTIIGSNNDWIVPVGLDNRRFVIVEMPEKRKPGYYKRLAREISGGGFKLFVRWLYLRDIAGFRPGARPAKTDAERDQAHRSMTHFQQYIHWLYSDECGGLISTARGEEVELSTEDEIWVNIGLLKDAYLDSDFGKRSRSGRSGLHGGIKKPIEQVLECSIKEKLNVPRPAGIRGKGLRMPRLG